MNEPPLPSVAVHPHCELETVKCIEKLEMILYLFKSDQGLGWFSRSDHVRGRRLAEQIRPLRGWRWRRRRGRRRDKENDVGLWFGALLYRKESELGHCGAADLVYELSVASAEATWLVHSSVFLWVACSARRIQIYTLTARNFRGVVRRLFQAV